ncbi:hypothetical protein [Mariniflexile sp. AS56]|uniref:hypothetical protein n=1 Tax=Mariniflexile sp. AS56 TaxID=3063957 RepID=UPI0026EC8280|nr:hypothetical protein [Mariniflexile sp. AS56]MDO7173066.1 hypothetical protein [Mariniflexile sp. AS56]
MRNQIWAELCNLRFKGYCLNFLMGKFQKWDRNINIFLAIASSGSIAAWAIWDSNPLIWGGIIALSQVITVIKPYFPYYKYVKELNSKCLKIDVLNIEFERLWHKIQNGLITSEQSADAYFEYRKEIAEILNFNDDILFEVGNNIINKSNFKMKIYLKNNYGIDININN